MTVSLTKSEISRRVEQSMRDKKKQTKSNKAHNKSSVGIGRSGKGNSIGKSFSAPVNRYQERIVHFETGKSNVKGADLMCRGQDFLQVVTVPAPTAGVFMTPGFCLTNIPINPLIGGFANTRLSEFGRLYEKYCFKNLRFHVQSAVPTNATGSYLVAYDRDMADDTPVPSEEGVKEYFAMDGTRSAAVYEDCTISCPLLDTQDFYYCNYTGVDGRLTTQGQLYVACLSGMTFNSNYNFNVWVEYEVHFMIPQLQSVPSIAKSIQTGSWPLGNGNGATYISNPVDMTATTDPVANGYIKAVAKTIPNIPSDYVNQDGIMSKLGNIQRQYNLARGTYEVLFRTNVMAPATTGGTNPSIRELGEFCVWTNKLTGSEKPRNVQFKADQSYDRPAQVGQQFATESNTYEDDQTLSVRQKLVLDTVYKYAVNQVDRLTARFIIRVNDIFSQFIFAYLGTFRASSGSPASSTASTIRDPILTIQRVEDAIYDQL